eukprot:249372-Rhodomonas_salina.2
MVDVNAIPKVYREKLERTDQPIVYHSRQARTLLSISNEFPNWEHNLKHLKTPDSALWLGFGGRVPSKKEERVLRKTGGTADRRSENISVDGGVEI